MVFPSFYEMSNPLTTVRKQHFWDWFSGDTLNSRWTTTGSGSVSVKDEVDGGIVINSGSGAYHQQRIDFGNAGNTGSPTYQTSHGLFSYTAHEWIAIFKYVSGSVQKTTMGLVGGDGAYGNYQQGASAVLLDKNANLIYQRRNTGATSTTAQAVDGNWHSAKNTLSGGTLTTSIDGVLSGTGFTSESTGMPTVKSAPLLEVYNSNASGGAAETQFRYFEAYNT
jgi:hypothetical protein